MEGGRLRRSYAGVAVFWLNVCLALVVLNLVALLYLRVSRPRPAGPEPSIGAELIARVYPQLGAAEVDRLVSESVREMLYEPFTEFREKPFVGKYVNVDEHGFRVTAGQGPWPPSAGYLNVFLFGGSTTFNYGIADDDTIASRLQVRLAALGLAKPARVYNFGRGAYYSSQERALFEKLLVGGVTPDVAVFVDGLNDFFFHEDMPAWTPWLAQMVAQAGHRDEDAPLAAARALPLARALGLFARPPDVRRTMAPVETPQYDDPAVTVQVLDRYATNKRLIEAVAAAAGVRAFFVWQPVPTFRYQPPDGDRGRNYGRHEYSRFGYPRMAERAAAMGSDFLWCADIQEGAAGVLYVDQVHYSPRMSDMLAACIVGHLRERGGLS